VKQNGNALQYVREDLKTVENGILCITAVQTHGHALEYVPEELQTPELCMIAVKNQF
jgi:hypothetical protein